MTPGKKITHLPAKASPAGQGSAVTPWEMLGRAVERGADVATMERLMSLHERWEAAEAKKAFYEAKAAFKANAPDVTKDMENKQFASKYASIGNLVNTVNESLSAHGLDASWTFDQTEKLVSCTCTLTHVAGYSQSVTLSGPPDTTGSKNAIQQIKSTTTYLKIATYEAVTGIASKEANADDDGNASQERKLITDAQVDELIALADEVGADKAKFCGVYKIESFADIPADQFEKAKAALMMKKKKTDADR